MVNKPSKTVYFFGAGASHASDFELPIMKGFFRDEDSNLSSIPNLYKFIQTKFPNQSLSELNLEMVITFLELSIDTFGSFGEHPDPYLYQARREFDTYVNKRLSIPEYKECNKHMKILARLKDQKNNDTIITINYDLIIDNVLYKLRSRLLNRGDDLLGKMEVWDGEIISCFQHDDIGFYLKLHGSTNWLYCPNATCENHRRFFPNKLSSKVRFPGGSLCNFCGSPTVSVIIPPTMYKSFENFPKLGFLWSLAYRELKEANKIILIGVSLAESDYYLNWLVAAAARNPEKQKTIEVVNTDRYVCDKVKNLTGIEPNYIGDFDSYASSIN